MTYSTYELKYCERCGGLGLRRSKSGSPYCCDCEQMMRNYFTRPATAANAPGQLRRIVQRLGQYIRPADQAPDVQEAARAF